ncbi:MAG: hypothetical protein WA056_06150 [Gallionella sp.]
MSLFSHNAVKWGVLGIALTAIVVGAPPKESGMAKTARSTALLQSDVASALARAKPKSQEAASVELERLARQQAEPEVSADAGNVFAATSWYVPPPPPPPPPPAPPPVPTAPPMPFTYIGRYEDAPTRLTILIKGERMYTVAEGDVIDDTYRVERVAPGVVELTYLPLNIKQTLSTGEAL